MQTGHISMTARAVATRRAAHQLLDRPALFDDPIAVPILGPELHVDPVRHADPRSRAFRAFMAARSRYAEDHLRAAVGAGARQYVILGAGMDTFAYRNPWPRLTVYEVDFPSMQQFKRTMLHSAGIEEPANVKYVPFDLEHRTLLESLKDLGFQADQPAFLSWLGVVPYLSLASFRSTLDLAASLPAPSAISFDYSLSPSHLSPRLQAAQKSLAARVAAAGEPFQLYFTPEQVTNELHTAGFDQIEQTTFSDLNQLYFNSRSDGLAVPAEGMAQLVTAWV